MIARGIAVLTVTLAPALAWAQQPATAQPQPTATKLGGPGESCRARSDCTDGLKCQNQTCTDEHEGQSCTATADCGQLRCIEHKCTSGATSSGSGGGGGAGGGGASEWMQFKFGEGMHPFIGIGVMGGPALAGVQFLGAFQTITRGAFLFALQGGVMIDRHQLSLEISPGTYTPFGADPSFQFNASYAYMIPLVQGDGYTVSWPLRFGAGMMAGNTGGFVYFEARADLVGVAVSVGHLLLDFGLPSFRYAVTASNGQSGHLFSWLFGMNASYLF